MATKLKVKAKRRKPQDATLRNVRASRSHEKAIVRRLERLERMVGRINFYLRAAGRR